MSNIRFNEECDNLIEAKEYFRNRGIQLLMSNFKLLNEFQVLYDENNMGWGLKATFQRWNKKTGFTKKYNSVYVYKSWRGKGLYTKWLKAQSKNQIITAPDCKIESFLKKVLCDENDEYVIAGSFMKEPEYRAIENFYGNKKADRSQQFLMNHIDEGLFVLKYFNASKEAKKAYCIHPFVQKDEDLYKNYKMLSKFNPKIVALAIEYRSVANEYLAHAPNKHHSEIRLSPLREVTDMLKADKVQNYKDFLLYHKGRHPNTDRLDEYFLSWLDRLEISIDTFDNLKSIMTI